MLAFVLTIVWLAAGGSALVWGLEYYLLAPSDRAFSELAPLFAPTGLVGQGLGILGSLMMIVGVAGYTARKRVPALSRAGALKHWLQVHIFLCTLGPFFVLLHTTFKFGGLVSIAFWSMAIVVASGVFGRYVYVRIPKTLNGRFLGMEAVEAQVEEVTESIRARTGLAEAELSAVLGAAGEFPERPGLLSALALALKEDVAGRLRTRSVRRLLAAHGVPARIRGEVAALARRRARIRKQTLLLRPFQQLFRYWHVVHLPLAVVMFLVLGLHVTVAILFGYTWIF